MALQEKEKQSRIRIGPNKKWSVDDELKILFYLKETVQNHSEIEKPTAICYWQKFLDLNPKITDATVQNVKNKSKNLKAAYIKFLEWKNGTGQGVDLDEPSVKEKIAKFCPHFEILEEIYGPRHSVDVPFIIDTATPQTEEIEDNSLSGIDNIKMEYEIEETNSQPSIISTGHTSQTKSSQFVNSGKKRKSDSDNSLQLLAEVIRERNEAQKQKMENEKKKNEMDFEIEKRKLELEEKKLEEETKYKMRELELQHEFQLRRLEMEERMRRRLQDSSDVVNELFN